jgi:hypothetical protein
VDAQCRIGERNYQHDHQDAQALRRGNLVDAGAEPLTKHRHFRGPARYAREHAGRRVDSREPREQHAGGIAQTDGEDGACGDQPPPTRDLADDVG